MTKRFFPARPKGLPKGYDSWDEHELATGLLKDHEHHPIWIPYVIEKKYQPDFVIKTKDKEYLVEFKGYFRDNNELMKYNWVRKVLREDQELIFVFDKLTKPIHFKAKRKCGTKMTCLEWGIKNGYQCFDKKSFEVYFNTLDFNLDN